MNRRVATLALIVSLTGTMAYGNDIITEKDNGMFSSKTEILLFSATWCGPCQRLKSQLKKEGLYDDVTLMDCSNGSTFKSYSSKYKFRAVPTVIVMRNGKEIARGGLSTVRKYAGK